jgi:hypothetical protein
VKSVKALARNSSIALGAVLISVLAPGSSLAFQVVVNGTTYDITTKNDSGNAISSDLTGTPWYNNQSLAAQFAAAAYSADGGTPNSGDGPTNPKGYYFAWFYDSSPGQGNWSVETYSSTGAPISIPPPPNSVPGNGQNRVWALGQPVPSKVPAPLPILGATAAFGMSRRLRRRISLSGLRTSASS